MGPFLLEIKNRRFVIVATNYFTKWVKTKATENIRDVDAKKFIWKKIVTRFGVPNTFISDNIMQFDSKAFKKYCRDLEIKNRYSSLAYP